jgi:hypothetical protein
MSSSTASQPPFQQWQSFFPGTTPYTNEADQILAAMQNQVINNNIYEGTSKTLNSINETNRLLTGEMTGLSKDISQSSLGLRDAIERGNLVNSNGIERTSAVTQGAIERTAGITQTAIERVAGEGRLTTTVVDAASRQAAADSARDIMRTVDQTSAAVNSAVERNGNAASVTSERIGGNVMTAIERVAGEGRLTTTVTDAASRQAAADSARDITSAVERNGGAATSATNAAYAGLLGSVERTSGENRAQFLAGQGTMMTQLGDVRHSILNDVNRGTNEVLTAGTQSLNVINKAVTDSAWENRTSMATGFAASNAANATGFAELHNASAAGFSMVGMDALKTKSDLAMQSANEYANILLEQQKAKQGLSEQAAAQFAINQLENQKIKEGLAGQSANHYSSLLLEQQKVKEYLSSKSDGHFAMNQLEMQKVKEGLACQAANNFAINQLEQQKVKEHLSMQLADAKYEALKSQQFLADKMDHCCCSIKEKMDVIDRDRLRDNLIVQRDETNLLKFAEFGRYDGYRGGHHGHHGHGGHHGER